MNAPQPTLSTLRQLPAMDKDLIDRAARLAFLVEAGERRERQATAELLRTLIAYHETMAELTARTTAFCIEAQVRINRARADHLERAKAAKQELAQLEAGVEVDPRLQKARADLAVAEDRLSREWPREARSSQPSPQKGQSADARRS